MGSAPILTISLLSDSPLKSTDTASTVRILISKDDVSVVVTGASNTIVHNSLSAFPQVVA